MKHKLNEDPKIACYQLANELADGSIVNQALARYLYQVIEFMFEEYIAPLRKENAELKKRLGDE